MKKDKGFTLIELMVTVAIIAILAAILLPSYVRSVMSSQLDVCEHNEQSIATAIELYRTDDSQGNYPGTLPILVPNYLQKVPFCPADLTKSPYDYQVGATFQNYTIQCRGNHSILAPATYPQYSAGGGLKLR